MKRFDGVYSALFSIYDENMNVKKDSVHKAMKFQRDNGLKGFYVAGNTGECTVLPNKTRMQMLEAVLEEKGDSEVMAHIGAGHFDDVKALLDHANACGVDAVASLPPSLMAYYGMDSIFEYYKYLAENSKAPVLAYITTVMTGNVVGLAQKILQLDNIIGVKLSIPNYYLFEQIRNLGSDFNILNGPDETMICGLISGANGAVGTTYNILPATAASLYDSVQNGDLAAAKKAQTRLNRMIDKCLGKGGIGYWKEALGIIAGIDMGYNVFPAIPVSKEALVDLEAFIKAEGYEK